MSDSTRPFGMRDKLGYMFGDFGNDFTFILTASFLMKFYTDVMGISPAIVGTMMMVVRFLDAVTDVTMGQIVDRSKPTKDGKFRPWIKRMCGPVAIASFLIFQSGFAGMSTGFKVFWMFFTYILWGPIFYTSINIPYGSMASAITLDPNGRAQLSTYRSMGATLAGLVIGAGTPMLAYTVKDGATVLSGSRMTIIAGVFSICAIICHILCFNLVRERVQVPQNTSKLDVGALLKSIATNKSLIGIIIAAILLLLGMLGMQGMGPYVFPVYYGSSKAQSMSQLLGSACMLLICVPLASRIAAKVGKKEMSAASCMIGAIVYIICLMVRPKNAFVYVAFYAVAYTGLSFFNTVVWAMITDVIDDAEVKNGVREDGAIYSVYSFARKVGQGLSSGMIGAILGSIGYTGEVAANPTAHQEVVEKIFNWACLIPAMGLAAVSLSLIFFYPLSKKSVEENVLALTEKNK